MSRSGCTDGWDYDTWDYVKWRGAVTSALRGKRGQLFLMEMLTALDELPIKRLVKDELIDVDRVSFSQWGMHECESVCAIGAVGRRRGVDMSGMDPEDYSTVAGTFNLASAMTQEIVYINDESGYRDETPEERFKRVRAWVASQVRDFSL